MTTLPGTSLFPFCFLLLTMFCRPKAAWAVFHRCCSCKKRSGRGSRWRPGASGLPSAGWDVSVPSQTRVHGDDRYKRGDEMRSTNAANAEDRDYQQRLLKVGATARRVQFYSAERALVFAPTATRDACVLMSCGAQVARLVEQAEAKKRQLEQVQPMLAARACVASLPSCECLPSLPLPSPA